ncbi:EAL domain-containing protein [Cognatiyoonia sp. IB215182]|uniref:EAL domain-containing protein n=1 Tax=Cognatiyoonia sp. IB215182 TaxID=3097353 RepID=UPI002A0E0064|nr:EAL domain-containing protein [Cognatiyoonia sp. IB215182]MDX8352663.1 EAL domain-containing protein [Cognatiyoonia sp. IB215182]
MQNATLARVEMDEQALIDPLHYAMASRDADVMLLVNEALDAGRARLAFHPIVTADAEPRVAFYEGLVRLMDDAGRIIPAAHFMPLVDETGMGRQIDCATLDLALKFLRQNPSVRLSVNVSARSIGDGEWRRILDAGLLHRNDLGDRLIFEISETSAMMLHENVIRFMAEMQPKGVGFALDGFGAGMTAFRYLKDFFFDLVKIDKSFIRGIESDPDNQVLAEALITVAHQFEMFAVADGVETAAEAAFLRQVGVDCLQGYYFGVPKFDL